MGSSAGKNNVGCGWGAGTDLLPLERDEILLPFDDSRRVLWRRFLFMKGVRPEAIGATAMMATARRKRDDFITLNYLYCGGDTGRIIA
mmetsp:Transcript_31607/g.66460  ORF Transcript_31607/g.66460 Transcript_31607/m.66460 type:complete len:88 (+) Transcript_31607:1116-1379(+)